jgi:hypothetical protein
MPWNGHERHTVFLAFSGADAAAVSGVAAGLRRPGLQLDYGVCSAPFSAQRSDIIRASLMRRLARCTATLCLFGDATLRDEWVLWALSVARHLEIPLFGAPLCDQESTEAVELLRDFGVEVVSLEGETFARRLPRQPAPVSAATASETSLLLRLMRHPLR